MPLVGVVGVQLSVLLWWVSRPGAQQREQGVFRTHFFTGPSVNAVVTWRIARRCSSLQRLMGRTTALYSRECTDWPLNSTAVQWCDLILQQHHHAGVRCATTDHRRERYLIWELIIFLYFQSKHGETLIACCNFKFNQRYDINES